VIERPSGSARREAAPSIGLSKRHLSGRRCNGGASRKRLKTRQITDHEGASFREFAKSRQTVGPHAIACGTATPGREGPFEPDVLPGHAIAPRDGARAWLVDATTAAAGTPPVETPRERPRVDDGIEG